MFQNRIEAGKILAGAILEYDLDSPLVLAIPRGGVVVGREVALALGADLDVVLARKIGAPFNPEFAVAAADPDGKVVFSPDRHSGISKDYILEQSALVRESIERGLSRLRGQRPEQTIAGRSVLVVDDGLATGLTAMAALRYIQRRNPRNLYMAVPVAPQDTLEAIRPLVEDIICPLRPPVFYSVGEWYVSFDQVSDGEVRNILEEFPPKVF